MTQTSLEELNKFLSTHDFGPGKESIRVADYGGTDSIGGRIVPEMLAFYGIKDYTMLDFDNGHDLREPVAGKKFNLGICMDLFEHTTDPKLVARNIMDSLDDGAIIFVTVPYVWQVHGYSEGEGYDDYWRFTPGGLHELFKEMQKNTLYTLYDSYKPEEELPPESMAPKLPWSRIVGIFKKPDKPKK